MIGFISINLTTTSTNVKAVNWAKASKQNRYINSKATVPKNTKFVVYKVKKNYTHEIWDIFWWPKEWDSKSKYLHFSKQGTGTTYDYNPAIRVLTDYAAKTDAAYYAWHGLVLVAEGNNSSVLKRAPEGIQGNEAPYRLVYYYEPLPTGARYSVVTGYLPEAVLKKHYIRGQGTFDFSKDKAGNSFIGLGSAVPLIRGKKVIKGLAMLRHLKWNAKKKADFEINRGTTLNPYTGPIKTKRQRHLAEEGILNDLNDYDTTNDPEGTISRAKQGLKRLGYSDNKIEEILNYKRNHPNPDDSHKYLFNRKSFYLD